MNGKDWTALVIFTSVIIVILLPWQIYFLDQNINRLYQVLIYSTLISPIIYFIYKIRILRIKKNLLIPAYIGLLLGIITLISKVISAQPIQNTYLMLYTRMNNENETIEIIHNHISTHNWNETKHLINYPNLGLRIERDFNQTKLKGSWFVHKDNPFCSYEGVNTFNNGKLVNKK
jgi:hypothetical protein